MTKPSRQIAAPEDGPQFIEYSEFPTPEPGDVCFVQRLENGSIAGVWVKPDHYDSDEMREIAWTWWYSRLEAVEKRRKEWRPPTSLPSDDARRPRHLELL